MTPPILDLNFSSVTFLVTFSTVLSSHVLPLQHWPLSLSSCFSTWYLHMLPSLCASWGSPIHLVFSSIPWSFFAFFKDISNSRFLHSESVQWYELLFPSDIKTERLENVLINIWLGSVIIDNDKNCPPRRSDANKKKQLIFSLPLWLHQMHKLYFKKRVTWFTVLCIGDCGLNRFIPGLWLKPGFKFKPLSWY